MQHLLGPWMSYIFVVESTIISDKSPNWKDRSPGEEA